MNLKKVMEITPEEVRDYAWENAQINTRYVGWLDLCDCEYFLRVYAFRKTKSYGFQLREVIREDIEDVCTRDMYFTGYFGWKVVYKPETRSSSNWYGYTYYSFREEDFGIWQYQSRVGVSYEILNLNILYEGKYKYCGYQSGNLFEYLRAYEKDPQVEFFGKIGIKPSKSLIAKCKKDKGFAHFLWQNKDDYFTPKALIYAYDNHLDCQTAQEIIFEKARSVHYAKDFNIYIRGKKVDKVKIYRYCNLNHIQPWNYRDYLKAIDYLGLDFTDSKNLYPKDFKRMHDLRANEYASKKAQENKKAAKELAENFKNKNNELRFLESQEGSYLILLPNTLKDLKHEGSKLHHCVGKMGYDVKVVKGTSIIAFVREKETPDKPFVTVEYDIKKGRVTQCYGDHDSRPAETVINFVNDWADNVRKELKASGI